MKTNFTQILDIYNDIGGLEWNVALFWNVVVILGPPLWSSGQSSWLHIQGFGFDSRLYRVFREVVGLERGPLSLVNTIEELLRRKSSDSGLEIRDYGRRVSAALIA
jgi:hypothetical protein